MDIYVGVLSEFDFILSCFKKLRIFFTERIKLELLNLKYIC